ncbi:hypothetical protein LEM8419_03530 [Neolewinella maritima]|uniref:Calcineurin-like phosphoesterase domain-containing protein n=1 Tax=Neolewinella maritima TaxID=1383882 RepID=A0ABM9B5I9_9BACT|nr:metallophosphoesterase [Neolewinella maritima]CAH1002658.1 hypothetical protein LEM8419_03530 [Neolewinella maritima]
MTQPQIKALLASNTLTMRVAEELVAAGVYTSLQTARKEVAGYRKLSGMIEGHHVSDDGRQMETDIGKGTAKEVFTVDNPPTCLEDALTQSRADLDVWELDKWVWNHWAGRYQVKLWFKQREQAAEDVFAGLMDAYRLSAQRTPRPAAQGSGVGVVALADFHFGMDYKGDYKNDPFNVDTLTDTVRRVADRVNVMGYEEVHVCLLGDFIESFSGTNHVDTWKHLSEYGWEAVRGVTELIRTELIGRIRNVKAVYLVAGNHDRTSMKKDLDPDGQAAKMVADLLDMTVAVPVHFDYKLLNPIIDGVQYILTHGDKGLSSRDMLALTLEYGSQHLYNVLLQGHNHSRKTVKGYRHAIQENTTCLEESNVRKITVPPLVTGGAYSASLGRHSTAGLTIIRRSGRGIDHLDAAA